MRKCLLNQAEPQFAAPSIVNRRKPDHVVDAGVNSVRIADDTSRSHDRKERDPGFGCLNRRQFWSPVFFHFALCIMLLIGLAAASGLDLPPLLNASRDSAFGVSASACGMLMVIGGLISFVLNRLGPHINNQAAKTTTNRRPASYARFDADHQNGTSVPAQQRQCREKAAQQGHSIEPELEFSDQAVSGGVRGRDGWNALMAAVSTGQVSVLYLCSLARLARDPAFGLAWILELVQEHGVRVVSIDDGFDSALDDWKHVAVLLTHRHAS